MKKLLFIIALALSLVGCSEKYYFELTDKDAIAPVLSDSEAGTELFSGLQNVDIVAQELLNQNGISESSISPNSAIVINDQQVIADIVEQFGFDPEAVGVEAKTHSLVVGYVGAAYGNDIVRQRAKIVFGKVCLHLEIQDNNSSFPAWVRKYFMALYPADLPLGPVDEIYCTYK
jgi:uncharacterized protein YcfL